MLRRDGHPLGVRRAEATKAAISDEEREETALSRKRWTLSIATGALLVAGTFAGALGLHGDPANTAGAAPEHAPASPGHTPGGGPVVGAPVPGQSQDQQQPQQQQPQGQPDTKPAQPTTPSSAGGPQAETPVAGGGSDSGSGSGQTGGTGRSGGDTSTPAPTPSPTPQQPPTQEQPPAQEQQPEQQQGPVGGLLGTVGDVLSPVTGAVGGILSPNSAQTDSTAATTSTKAAPSGPALTMIDPLGGLLAS
jgi:hypothetical protein